MSDAATSKSYSGKEEAATSSSGYDNNNHTTNSRNVNNNNMQQDDEQASSSYASADRSYSDRRLFLQRQEQTHEHESSQAVALSRHDWTSDDFFVVLRLYVMCYTKLWKIGLNSPESVQNDVVQQLQNFKIRMNDFNPYIPFNSSSTTINSLRTYVGVLNAIESGEMDVSNLDHATRHLQKDTPIPTNWNTASRIQTNFNSFTEERMIASEIVGLVEVIFNTYALALEKRSSDMMSHCMSVLMTLQSNLEQKHHEFSVYWRLASLIHKTSKRLKHTDLINMHHYKHPGVSKQVVRHQEASSKSMNTEDGDED
jgi:hypothetical protein